MGVWGGRLGRSVERKDYTHKKEVKLIVRFGVCLGMEKKVRRITILREVPLTITSRLMHNSQNSLISCINFVR